MATDWTLEAIFKANTVSGGVSMGLVGTDFAAAADRMALKAEQWESTGQMGYTKFGVVDVTFEGSAAATPAVVVYDRALSPAEISAHYSAIPEPTVLSLGVLGGVLVWGVRRRTGS